MPQISHEVDEPNMVLALVAAGLGISLVPESTCKLERAGVGFRPLHPSPPIVETALAWRRDNASLAVEGFLQAFHEARGRRANP